jgi:hypothetical protein
MYVGGVWKSAVVVCLESGCSLVGTSRVPDPLPPDAVVHCTERSLPVVVDVALTAAAVVGDGLLIHWAVSRPSTPTNIAPGVLPIVGLEILAIGGVMIGVPFGLGASAVVGHVNNVRCRDAHTAMRAYDLDPDARVDGESRPETFSWGHDPDTPGEKLAHDGLLAAERGDCKVVRAIADQLRTLDEPLVLDKYLHDAGVAQCMP